MTIEEWITEMMTRIKVKLGGGVVCVELTDDQLRSAIQEAVDWFGEYIRRGRKSLAQIPLTVGQNLYDVPEDCFLPVRLTAPRRTNDILTGSMEWVHPDLAWPSRGELGFSGIVQDRQYLALGTRVLGNDFKFVWMAENRKIIVDRITSSDTFAILEYLSNTFDPEQLTPGDKALIFKWAFAEAQETLGNIRSKYSELQGSAGTYSLNGQDLLQAAEMAKSILEEKIKRQVPPPRIQRG